MVKSRPPIIVSSVACQDTTIVTYRCYVCGFGVWESSRAIGSSGAGAPLSSSDTTT